MDKYAVFGNPIKHSKSNLWYGSSICFEMEKNSDTSERVLLARTQLQAFKLSKDKPKVLERQNQ